MPRRIGSAETKAGGVPGRSFSGRCRSASYVLKGDDDRRKVAASRATDATPATVYPIPELGRDAGRRVPVADLPRYGTQFAEIRPRRGLTGGVGEGVRGDAARHRLLRARRRPAPPGQCSCTWRRPCGFRRTTARGEPAQRRHVTKDGPAPQAAKEGRGPARGGPAGGAQAGGRAPRDAAARREVVRPLSARPGANGHDVEQIRGRAPARAPISAHLLAHPTAPENWCR